MTITPLHYADGVRLRMEGEAGIAHHTPLAVALQACMSTADEVTVDCRRVTFPTDAILHTLITLANSLHLPQRLCLWAGPELALTEQCARRGWDRIITLRLRCT